ncbi:MAG TPA: MFS transporter [Actinomycetes bacterium]|nr:MFS transporter [Actinomycetes bacterium]
MRAAGGAFVTTWRNPDLRRAQLGFAGAWTAEWTFTVGLGVYAFREGGSTAVGLVALLRTLPSAVVAPFATVYADRWRRERLLVLASAVRGIACVLTALLAASGGPAPAVYALAVASTVAAVLYRPVHSALLPSLCRTPTELAGANVVRGMLDSLSTLIGPAVAAVLLAVSGVTAVFLAAAVASLWSAAMTLRVHPEVMAVACGRRTGVWSGFVAGVRVIGRSRPLLMMFTLTTAQILTRGALSVLTVVVAIDVLHIGEAGVGTLTGAVGAGAVVGSVAASAVVGSRRLAALFGVGVATWGLPIAVIGLVGGTGPALVLLACVGIGNALVDVGLFTLIARLAPDAVLGRVFGVLESVGALGMGVGALLVPGLIALGGVHLALVVVGFLDPLLVVLCWRGLLLLDASMTVRDEEVALLRSVPMLRPLPLPAIELLANGLEPVHVSAGVTVFAQGDPGDRCYVIEQGSVEVVGDGRTVTTLGPGDLFGEIALLRQVPRTATVVARTDLVLASLRSQRFLSVVTGFRSSAAEAQVGVDGRLDRFAPGATG